jgi:hypothetical protein
MVFSGIHSVKARIRQKVMAILSCIDESENTLLRSLVNSNPLTPETYAALLEGLEQNWGENGTT